LREIIGSTKFAATFGICSILIILSFFTGIKNYQTGVQENNASKVSQLQEFEKYTEWDRVSGQNVFLPPEPLASLVMGVSNDIGRTTGVNGRNTPTTSRDSIYSEQPVFAVFRFLDLEFVFQIILSLFAILFAFDAVNGEKERGTLRLSFANAVPRATYILGKLTGSFLALALPLLIPVLIGILLLPLMGLVLSNDEWLRLGLFIVSGMLYLGVFLTLSAFLSCLTQRSSSAFLFLLMIWIFSVLIIPRASVLIAGNMVKVPTIEEISFQQSQLMRQYSDEFGKRLRNFSKETYEKQRNSGDFSPEARKKAQDSIIQFLNEIETENSKKVEDLTSRLNEERHNKQVQQEKLAFGISRISPAAVFNLASTTLCGTSLDLKNHFLNQASIYSETFAEFIRRKTGHNPGDLGFIYKAAAARASGEKTEPAKPINPREIPEFLYQPPELSNILHDALPDIAILILFNLIFFSGAFLTFLRYDLR
jgi:ABC-type transport system involved in multi-copper enzyme maturation permease subunit